MKSVLVSVVALSLTLPLCARAGDLCLNAAGTNPPTFEKPVIIGRGFSIPKKNKCKPFAGVIAVGPALASAVTGSACTSFNGTNVTFMFVAAVAPSNSSHIDLYYAASLQPQTGMGRMTTILGNTSVINPLTASDCHDAYPDNL